LSLKLVLQAGCSLRGAAATLALLVQQGLLACAVPSFSTIRCWLLRVGYDALTRPLPRQTPWLWLVDHTMQIGSQKLLVILGCPLTHVPFGERALQLSDLQLVALVPMATSTGALVAAELEQAIARTGRPRLIVADQGSDLRKGILDFHSWYPRTAYVPDMAHVGANVLHKAWDEQPRWQQFVKQLQTTTAKLQRTPSAYLRAPRLRPAARFMNVRSQLLFARRVLRHLDSAVPHAKALQYYGWLPEFRDELAIWEREQELVQTTIDVVRVEGLHVATESQLERAWGPLGERASTLAIAERLRGYVRQYQPPTQAERFVASTEVLESSFGKLKRLEQQQSQDGLTGLVLALGAVVGTSSDGGVQEALERTPQKKVDHWLSRVFGRSLQWLRRQFFKEAPRTKNGMNAVPPPE
jgi:plasmid stabilization system protein ParE